MATLIVIAVVSGALLLGAAWGLLRPPPDWVMGEMVALAGGALLLAAVLELIEPATGTTSTWAVGAAVMAGAGAFAAADAAVDRWWGADSGGGLLAAITLDGVPENLALGVALIGASTGQVAALAGSILLSNLPEAAGGAKEMRDDGVLGASTIFGLWAATAVLLSVAALVGHHLLADASASTLALIRAFAGGAVVSSLAVEVFPTAFGDGRYATGVTAAAGLVLALALHQMA